MAPVTIRYKILFQKLCQDKIDWDDPLSESTLCEWKKLVADLGEGTPISVPRSHFHSVEGPATLTLCGFSDASTRAYAAVVYLRMETSSGVVVRFVISKTRVAPLQPQTIPRLELLSAVLLSRLIVSILSSIGPTLPPQCYTNSQVALYWIRGTSKEWKPFVRNRVMEICRNVQPSLWSYCPGKSNPADLPSRGLTTLEVAVSQLWRQGPEWLYTSSVPSVESSTPYLQGQGGSNLYPHGC